tara:strand:+ start:166 stop:402 length:237 start_codon:yes stop_codon:yes gene_type:complete
MRPKFIVYCLAFICLIFGWKGLLLIEDINLALEARECYTEIQLAVLKEKIKIFSDFMVLAIVLSVVMSVCASFSRSCR